MIDRTKMPSVAEITTLKLLKAEKHILPNGIPLFLLNTSTAPLVKIECMFAAGNWYQKEPLSAFITNQMLTEGSNSFSSVEIANKTEYYGAQLSYNVDKDNAYVSIVCLRKYLAEVLPVLESIIKEANFPEQELQQFNTRHKHQYLVDQTKGSNIARMVHSVMLFGKDHPYGYYIKANDFETVQRNQIVSFHQNHYIAPNCKIIASGWVEEKEIKLIEKHFGYSWNTGKSIIEAKAFKIKPDPEKRQFIEKKDAVQSAIRSGKILFPRTHPDFPVMSLLICILGGYFGSRLMRTIREEKGYTYGINALFVHLTRAGYLSIVSEVRTEVTRAALDDVYSSLNELRTRPIGEEELQRVKNYMLGEMLRMFDGTFAQAESLVTLLENNLEYGHYETLMEEIKLADAQSIMKMAYQYLDPATFSEVVVGKMN